MTTDESMDHLERNLEQSLRRLAESLDLMLVKSRSRDPYAEDYGLYVLVEDTAGNRMGQHGGQAAVSEFARGGGMTLREVEENLKLIVKGGAEDFKQFEQNVNALLPILQKYGTVGDAIAAGAFTKQRE